MKPPIPFKWKGNHHLYLGLWLIGFGSFQWFMGIDNAELTTLIPIWKSFVICGALIAADDILEHKITASTPLRLLYEKAIKPVLQRRKNDNN